MAFQRSHGHYRLGITGGSSQPRTDTVDGHNILPHRDFSDLLRPTAFLAVSGAFGLRGASEWSFSNSARFRQYDGSVFLLEVPSVADFVDFVHLPYDSHTVPTGLHPRALIRNRADPGQTLQVS